MKTDKDPFGFERLHYVRSAEESKALNSNHRPMIIISASGMMEAGRVKHHIANNIANPNNTILMIGYCEPMTLGARLQEPGLSEISILGDIKPVNAQIKRIEAFSGHGDYSEMIDFLHCQDSEEIKNIFLVHGEFESQSFYKDQLEIDGFRNIEIPKSGDEFEL